MQRLVALNERLRSIFNRLYGLERKLMRALISNYRSSGSWWAFCLLMFEFFLLILVFYCAITYLSDILPIAKWQRPLKLGNVWQIGLCAGIIATCFIPCLRLAAAIFTVGLAGNLLFSLTWNWFWLGGGCFLGFCLERGIYSKLRKGRRDNYKIFYLKGAYVSVIALFLIPYSCFLLPSLLLIGVLLSIGKIIEKILWRWWPKWRIKSFAAVTREIIQKREEL